MATQLANPRANPITVIRQNLQAMAPEFRAALPAHVSVEKFTRVAQTAIQNQPDLANVDRKSLFGAIVRLAQDGRSEEHTSELQSLMRISYAVFCLKKKITKIQQNTINKQQI